MSEKRFTLTAWHEVKDNGKIMTVDEVVGKLNEQQAEIERLQKKIDNISNSYEKFYGVKLKYAHWLQGDD